MENTNYEEKAFGFMADYTSFEFAIGYSYSKAMKRPNLVHVNFMFWNIDLAW